MNGSKRFARRLALPFALGLGIVAAGCGGNKSSTTSSETSNPTTTPPAESSATAALGGGAMTDANIAAIVLAANQGDIDNGKAAQSKSKNADVKAFAKQMITDHSAANDKAKALATKLGMTPEDNDVSRSMKSQQDSIRTSLKSQSGGAFDKAYIDNEVTLHENVLNAIDQQLIPGAQNAELKQLLTDTRGVIQAHLAHAKQLQSRLGSTSAR